MQSYFLLKNNLMDIVDAIILGIIKGLTEFLPVSSSGHLEIGREILNADLLASENLLFTIILHFATAISTIIVFKEDIINLIKGSIANSINGNHKSLFKIIISRIPAVLIGLFFEEEIEIIEGVVKEKVGEIEPQMKEGIVEQGEEIQIEQENYTAYYVIAIILLVILTIIIRRR